MEFGLFTDMGYDAVWLAEIHFQKDRSVLASPLMIRPGLTPPRIGTGQSQRRVEK